MDAATRDGLIRHFASWIPEDSRTANPTYVALVDAVMGSDDLLALAALVPRPQFPANLLFASVHDLLLGGVDHPLATSYASVVASRGLAGTHRSPAEIGALFSDFVTEHRPRIIPLLEQRFTQTNEVQRCGVLHAAIRSVGLGAHDPVTLLDAGCSAGLNLFLDHYAITNAPGVSVGDPTSDVTITVEHRGAAPTGTMPTIVQRVGLDQHPLDPADDSDSRWLEACLWPDDLERFTRLQKALAIARRERASCTIRTGALEHELAACAQLSDPSTHLIVITSWAAAYLPEGAHEAFLDQLHTIGQRQEATWIAMEPAGAAHRLGLLDDAAASSLNQQTVVVATTLTGGSFTPRLLGTSHHHGYWLNLTA